MYLFEELNKPAYVEAVLRFNADGKDQEAKWIAKFRRQSDEEKKARERISAEKLDAIGRMEAAAGKKKKKGITAVQIAQCTKMQADLDAYVENEALEHLVGWEISDGKGGFLPETDEIREAIIGTEAPREWRAAIVEAWKKHINPNREEIVKNSKTPPPSGQVVAINRG